MASKRKRKARVREDITARIKETRQRRHKKYGHSWTRGQRNEVWPVDATPEEILNGTIKARTFEDEYRSHKKTRGRRGWSYDPMKRKPENTVYLNRNDVMNTGKFHMVELMERFMQYTQSC